MAGEVGVLLVFVLLGVGAPLVLYYLVRSEHKRRVEMDREDAERVARRDMENRR